jgi:hypothetical protein
MYIFVIHTLAQNMGLGSLFKAARINFVVTQLAKLSGES